MKVLVISAFVPMPDRLGGDHRYFKMLERIVARHEVDFLAYAPDTQIAQYGLQEFNAYCETLARSNIRLTGPGVRAALRAARYDLIVFQHYSSAVLWLSEARWLQPQARMLADSGDVVYRRLMSKARLTGAASDHRRALAVKAEELAVYRAVDAITGVSEQDVAEVKALIPELPIFMVPIIHPVPETPAAQRDGKLLVFVGSFLHPPNVDGIVWFATRVFPQIAASRPDVRLRIIGHAPPPEVQALASAQVEVAGYVPQTAPHLAAASISIAPLRFGAGIKTKIGEAMAFGLPVVTTSVGAEGFGLRHDEEIVIADEPDEMAAQVLRLLAEPALRQRIGQAGFEHLQANFSAQAVGVKIDQMMSALPRLPVRHLGLLQTARLRWDDWLERHWRWRLARRYS